MTDHAELFGVLAQMPFGVICVENEGRINFANHFAVREIFGGDQILGDDFDELVERFQLRGESLSSVLDTELAADQLLLAVDRDGIRRYYSLTVAGPAAGNESATVIVFQEASPLVGLGHWLGRMIARSTPTESSDQLVRRLAAEVAHLVRNPLAAMTINAALLTRAELGDEHHGEIAADIEDSAARIADAVDRLIALGRGSMVRPGQPLLLDPQGSW